MPMVQLVMERESDERLDVAAVFKLLKNTFPAVQLVSQDALSDRAANARQFVDNLTMAPDMRTKILRTLERNAHQYGPAYSFRIPCKTTQVEGTLRPIDLVFLADGEIPHDDWGKIVDFVRGLRCGKVTVHADEA